MTTAVPPFTCDQVCLSGRRHGTYDLALPAVVIATKPLAVRDVRCEVGRLRRELRRPETDVDAYVVRRHLAPFHATEIIHPMRGEANA